ncbi:MAG: hypothetical protein ACLGI8_07890 [Acidimicrobiia bacterium]
MPDELWERYAGDLKALALLSQPSSAEDAKSILATASVFIVDATAGNRDLGFDDLFSEVEVSAYCTRFEQRKGRTKTYDNHRGRLNRLLRAKNGLPQQHRASRADRVELPPYTEAELRGVVDIALEQDDCAAAQLVALGAGAGRVGDDAYRTSSMPVLSSPADRLGHRPGEPVHVDAEAWKRARQHAEQARVELTQRRLEVTWAASLVASPGGPLGAVVREHRLSRRLLENVNRALQTPSDDEVVEALRRL